MKKEVQMNINKKSFIPYAIVIFPLSVALVLVTFAISLYIEKVTDNFNDAKAKSISEQIDLEKLNGEMWVNQINELGENKYSAIQEDIENELIEKVNLVHKGANAIYKKYKTKKAIQDRIKLLISNVSWNKEQDYIFIKNFRGDSIVKTSLANTSMDYMDIDGRTIFLEEIQKVRKRGEGFLYSKYAKGEPEEIIYVKKLGMYDWYIGSKIFKKQKIDELKNSLLETIKNIPIEKNISISLLDSKSLLFSTPTIKNKPSYELLLKTLSKKSEWKYDDTTRHNYYAKYYKALDLHIVYGFEVDFKSQKELKKQTKFIKKLDAEFQLIMKITILVIILIVISSLFLARKFTFNKEESAI